MMSNLCRSPDVMAAVSQDGQSSTLDTCLLVLGKAEVSKVLLPRLEHTKSYAAAYHLNSQMGALPSSPAISRQSAPVTGSLAPDCTAKCSGAGIGQVAAVGAGQPSHRGEGGGQAHICYCRDGSTHPAPQQPLGKPHCGRVWHQLGAAARQGAAGSGRHSTSLAPLSVAHRSPGGTATCHS